MENIHELLLDKTIDQKLYDLWLNKITTELNSKVLVDDFEIGSDL